MRVQSLWAWCAISFMAALCFSHIRACVADLIARDFLEGSVDVEQGHVVSLTGGELPACGEHLVAARRRVVQHRVHREQRHDAQHLLRAGEVWGQQDGLNRTGTQSEGRARSRVLLLGAAISPGLTTRFDFYSWGSGLESMLILKLKQFLIQNHFQDLLHSAVRYARGCGK